MNLCTVRPLSFARHPSKVKFVAVSQTSVAKDRQLATDYLDKRGSVWIPVRGNTYISKVEEPYLI